jgi:ABC-type sugar transport system ATPase subunit
MSGLELRNIVKNFGAVEVIRDVSLQVNDGEFVAFVGPSGCGKSTLLRLIAGLDKPTGGSIAIDGKDVTPIGAADRGLAMVFQSYALYPHMSVRENLAFGLENTKVAKAEIEARIADAARMLEIEPFLRRRPGQLSGGQRQRVAIGRAIVRRPDAFLLDEPLSNLDVELRVSMRAELAALHARLKATMIYVTHDQVEAMTLADKIVVLRKGVVEQIGAPMELYERPANLFVAGFIGSPRMNLINLTGAGTAKAAPDGSPVAVTGPAAENAVVLGMRADQMRIVAPGAGIVDGTVSVVERLGDAEFVYVRTGWDQELVVRVDGGTDLPVDQAVGLAFAGRTHFFDAQGKSLDGLRLQSA